MVRRGERWTILTQYYAPELGAPQLRLRSVARELNRHGIDVEVLTGMPNYPTGMTHAGYRGRWSMRERIDGVPVRRTWLYPATGRSAVRRIANYATFTLTALPRALFGPKPDRLFVESQPLTLGVVALLMRTLRRVPYIYNVPDLQVDIAREVGFLSSRRLLDLMTMLENASLRRAWSVSTVTDRFIEHFEERGVPRNRISFLPNGADTEFLRPLPPDEELLARWGLEGKKVFTYIGTHAHYHKLETLIEAAALLRERRDIAFLLIGDGPERERIKRLARDERLENVVFGAAPYEEMARAYSISYGALAVLRDIEVARKMRLSKVFPALSCEVPVIFSGAGETPEILEQHGAGIAVAPEDPAAMVDAIVRLADDPKRRDAMGRAGRELVVREFSWKVIVERWLAELGYVDDPSGRGA
jgi:glycosyltransferase involved in cell wall biosynthesis